MAKEAMVPAASAIQPKMNTGSLSVFSDAENFNTALRMATALAKSTVVPKAYQGNEGNCLIAIEMAARINTSPMMVMQNLYIVNGNPAWSSQWIIAMINSSHRYKTELQFDFGNAEEDGGLSCTAWAEDYSGHKVCGPKVTMKMARDEGWVSKNGSKWKTMPEVMIRYRAASFFGRMNCPDMIMGIYSKDEVIELGDSYDGPVPVQITDSSSSSSENASDSGEAEEDSVITQEQRQQLFKAAQMNLGKEEGNAVIKSLINEIGLTSTTNMKQSEYCKVVDRLVEICETRKTEQQPESEPADAKEPNE